MAESFRLEDILGVTTHGAPTLLCYTRGVRVVRPRGQHKCAMRVAVIPVRPSCCAVHAHASRDLFCTKQARRSTFRCCSCQSLLQGASQAIVTQAHVRKTRASSQSDLCPLAGDPLATYRRPLTLTYHSAASAVAVSAPRRHCSQAQVRSGKCTAAPRKAETGGSGRYRQLKVWHSRVQSRLSAGTVEYVSGTRWSSARTG